MVDSAHPETFSLRSLLDLFITRPGIRRSIDKAYEIVTYSLFESVITALGTRVKVSIAPEKQDLLNEFADLVRILIGLQPGQVAWEHDAHIFRVGVTNAADRGLDMWANFGPAIQVKHLTLNAELAGRIVEQVESETIVLVCRDAEAEILQTVVQQIGWGRRVRGVVKESDLINWYEQCLRGHFADQLATRLLQCLTVAFKAEFPQSAALTEFIEGRQYNKIVPPEQWQVESDGVTPVIEAGK